MAKKRNKETQEKTKRDHQSSRQASTEAGQRTSGRDAESPQPRQEETDIDKINRINQNRRGIYSRNGHGDYRGL